jgi:hypothetical protein
MISIKKNPSPEEVKFRAEPVLFVEGSGADSFDRKVIGELFENKIRIEPLGKSFSVKSVAEALYPYHKKYFFLIDRDHQSTDEVQRYWDEFPNPETSNLLIWKRKEIENYFLDPGFLIESDFCTADKPRLISKLEEYSNERLFLDVANYVIVSIRESQKKTWIKTYTDLIPSADEALKRLKAEPEFQKRLVCIKEQVNSTQIEDLFRKRLEEMTGNYNQIKWGLGSWLDLIQGKRILNQMINTSNCFSVKNRDGERIDGKGKLDAVVKNLLSKNDKIPSDFVKLKELIYQQINK